MRVSHFLFAALLIFSSCQSEDFADSNLTSTEDTAVRGLSKGPQGPDWEANCDATDFPADPNISACAYQTQLLNYLAGCSFRDASNYCDTNTPFSDGNYTTRTEFVDVFQLGLGSAWHDYIAQNPIPYFPVLCANMCGTSGSGIPVSNLVGNCGGAPYLQTITAADRDLLVSTALDFFLDHGSELIDVSCGEGSYLMPVSIEWTVFANCGGQCCVDGWEDCGDGTYAIVDLNGYTSSSVYNLYPRITFMCCTKNT